jgi:hypothetical protein
MFIESIQSWVRKLIYLRYQVLTDAHHSVLRYIYELRIERWGHFSEELSI